MIFVSLTILKRRLMEINVILDRLLNLCYNEHMAIPNKVRLTALHVICLHIFRHISQKASLIHKVFTAFFVSSDKKSDCASDAQTLCGIAIAIRSTVSDVRRNL